MNLDKSYSGIPWKAGGRTHAGVDCVGLAALWLREQMGIEVAPPVTDETSDAAAVLQQYCKTGEWERGDVVFFRLKKSGRVCHVATHLGEGKLLHILSGVQSRIDNGPTLLARLGFEVAGVISPRDSAALCKALSDQQVGWAQVALIVIAVALSLASSYLAPTLSGFKSKNGIYGDGSLLTQRNPEIPLADLLGEVVVSGNSVYQQLGEKGASVTPTAQKWNQIVILGSGPVSLIDYDTGLQIKGVTYSDKYFFDGTGFDGIYPNPAQDKAEAVTGSILSESAVPSVTFYDGAHGLTVPVDIRASYDRTFPIYGFSGCAYLVLRQMNAEKFQNFNMTCRVQGRYCRTFTSSGFIRSYVPAEEHTGDGTTVRFKLAHEDIAVVERVQVNSVDFDPMSATDQSGDVYHVNMLKGYIEFLTAPGVGVTIIVEYRYFAREWSQNPAMLLVYLLTEKRRGKGFDESRIDWYNADVLRDFCDDEIDWHGTDGVTTGPRYTANYAVDDRKPIQDHMQAILDACNSIMFLTAGKFVMRSRENTTSVFTFDSSNILVDDNGSTFSAELVDRGSKANRVKVLYQSEANLNAENEVAADDDVNQLTRSDRVGNDGVVEENLKFPALTGQAQAELLAEMAVAERVNSNYQYTWKTNIQGIPLQPGDVVDVESDVMGDSRTMRVQSIEHDAQDRVTITAGEFVAPVIL